MTPEDLDRAAVWNREAAIRSAHKINQVGQYPQDDLANLACVAQTHAMMVIMLRDEAQRERQRRCDPLD